MDNLVHAVVFFTFFAYAIALGVSSLRREPGAGGEVFGRDLVFEISLYAFFSYLATQVALDEDPRLLRELVIVACIAIAFSRLVLKHSSLGARVRPVFVAVYAGAVCAIVAVSWLLQGGGEA